MSAVIDTGITHLIYKITNTKTRKTIFTDDSEKAWDVAWDLSQLVEVINEAGFIRKFPNETIQTHNKCSYCSYPCKYGKIVRQIGDIDLDRNTLFCLYCYSTLSGEDTAS